MYMKVLLITDQEDTDISRFLEKELHFDEFFVHCIQYESFEVSMLGGLDALLFEGGLSLIETFMEKWQACYLFPIKAMILDTKVQVTDIAIRLFAEKLNIQWLISKDNLWPISAMFLQVSSDRYDKRIEHISHLEISEGLFYMLEKLGECIFILDKYCNIAYLNQRAAYLIESSFETVKGECFYEIIGLDNEFDEIDAKTYIKSVIEDKTSKGVPKFTKLKNNMNHEYYISANMNYVNSDDFEGVFIIMRDISRIMKTEMQIKQLSQAVEYSPDSVVITDIEGKIEYVNPAFIELTGYGYEEAIGSYSNILKSGKTPNATYELLWETILAGLVWKGEFLNEKKNGELYWERASIAPVRDDHGKIAHFVAIKQNFTQEKKLMDELTKERENLTGLVELTPVGIVLTNDIGQIVKVNTRMCQMIGGNGDVKQTSSILKKSNYYRPDSQKSSLSELVTEVIDKDRIIESELIRFESSNDERTRWLRVNGLSIDLDEEAFALFTIDDITEMKEMEEQLAIATEEAKEADKAKSLFLANMSHEIRTPINGIIGMTELTLETEGLNTEQKNNLNMVKYSSNNLLSIINDILDISKIDAEKITLESIPFSLNELIDNTYKAFDIKVKEKEIDFILNIQDNIPEYYEGDPYRIQQILNNILSNAIKFTDEGHVKLSVQATKRDNDIYRINIEVQDTGIGIDKESQNNLFQSFNQGDNSVTRKYGGTGLGLVITKSLIEMMKGKLTFNSHAGVGTVFTVTLSLPMVKTNKVEVVEESISYDLDEEIHVLIVEDEKVNMTIARNILTKAGYIVDEAVNGIEAVAMAREKVYNFILMDIQLPELDGVSASILIKKRYTKLKVYVPVIALTAYALKGDREKFLKAGMDEYIAKPYDRESLFMKIDKVLNQDYLELRSIYPNYSQLKFKDLLTSIIERANETFDAEKYTQMNLQATKARQIAGAFGLKDFSLMLLKLQMTVRKSQYEKAKGLLLEINVALKENLKKVWM